MTEDMGTNQKRECEVRIGKKMKVILAIKLLDATLSRLNLFLEQGSIVADF